MFLLATRRTRSRPVSLFLSFDRASYSSNTPTDDKDFGTAGHGGVMIDRSALFQNREESADALTAKLTTPLARELSQIILARGPVTVAEYMRQSLTHPLHGYYTTKGSVFGSKGDFTTAPEISQMFGELLGIWCVATWQQMGSPQNVQLVEIGPGRGTLMADMIRTFDKFEPFVASATCHMVEISETLRGTQKRALESLALGSARRIVDDMQWYRRIQDVKVEGPMIIIGQEILDALPIHQFEYTINGWRERLVDVNFSATDERGFRFVLSPGSTPALGLLGPSSSEHDFEVGDRLEVCPSVR